MNASPETYILFSLAADFSLCFVLVFVWFKQRSEWQALFWAASQLSLSAGTLVWYLGPAHWVRVPLAALALTVAVAGFWYGTEYLLGRLRRSALWPAMLGCCVAWAGLCVWWGSAEAHVEISTALALGGVMVWAGIRLVSNRNFYRLLGVILVVRGALNVFNAFGLVPAQFELWFSYSVLIKTLTMLCVVNAVQEKIRLRYARTLDSLTSGVLVLDARGVVCEANRGVARLLGYAAPSDLIGRPLAQLAAGPLTGVAQGYLDRLGERGRPMPAVETALHRRDGSVLPLDVIASRSEEGGLAYCILQLIDVSERKKKDEQLFRAARYDGLTGVLNRYGLFQELANAPGDGAGFAVLFIDLDYFQRINDCFGHAVGDQLLKQVAERLLGHLAPGDSIARLGGDEFVVVLRPRAGESATELARARGGALLRAFRASLAVDFQSIPLSASIGAACCPEHGRDAAVLLNCAETAMYEVKKSGRGELRLFEPRMNADARDALVIDAALRGAVAAGELHVLYQPIVDTATMRLKKVEALLRWQSPALGAVAPDRFIPVAEESDLIIELGGWVLNEACRQLAAWDCDMAVSVNISPRQLGAPGFLELVERVLAIHGLAANRLELELTERVLIGDSVNAHAVLRRLGEMGVRISLDDFGTGYSSLSYLTRFRIDTLKIDRSFVMEIEHSARSRNLVATIVGMGHCLGMELVAEGVETQAQAAALEGMGCHCLQGYYISRPVPPAEVPRLMLAGCGAVP